jgi:Fe-S cluster biogenesis protein NfuA
MAGPPSEPARPMDDAARRRRTNHPHKELAMKAQVQSVLDKIRPQLQADGGDVELVDVIDGVVKVRLKGACAGCPMSQMTLRNGIERLLKREIPAVKSVEGV